MLPITQIIPELLDSLRARPNAILIAPPGAGKTTLIPLALMDAFPGGKILVLEPRRLAARAAAARMAALIKEPVGQRIGFSTRLEKSTSPTTVVEVITEGLFTGRLLSDPGLANVTTVIFDEIHERSLESDLALALILHLQNSLRPELRILAMSATADSAPLAALLNAPIIESAGRAHSVAMTHSKRDIATARDLPEAMAAAIRAAVVTHQGDILAFLPGMAEIRRTESALANLPAVVLPLHGDLPAAAQDLALREHETRRVILATSIAETSLTVPGVRIVIDGGFRRAPKLDPATGLTRLVTQRISRAAAAQRAGRAGREGPGVAIRLWSEALHRGLPEFDRPQIFNAELSGLALSCAAWGEAPEDLPFPDPPPAGALAAARTLLTFLGALEAQKLTAKGRAMSLLRATPRLAAMMYEATTPQSQALAADLAAILEDRYLLPREAPADIALGVEALAGKIPADRAILARVRQAAKMYRARLHLPASAIAAGDPGALLAAAFPDRIAQSRGAAGSFRISGGGGGNLPPDDPLARAPLIVVASLDGKGAKIRLAAALDPANLPAALCANLTTTCDSGFDSASGGVLTRTRTRYGALVLSDRTSAATSEQAQTALAAAIATRPEQLNFSAAALNLQARVALLRALGEDLPDLAWPTLAATVQEWLTPYLAGMTNIREAAALNLHDILRAQLTRPQAQMLDSALLTHINLPRTRIAIDYTTPIPLAAARAQDFYGIDATPQLANGRIPLQLSLLSPAGRPIAITGDLANFWRHGWLDARRDMRGRYPKHDWPEQPWK